MKFAKYFLCLLIAAMLFSCEQLGSIDDIEPEHVLTDKSLFENESSTEALVNGMYKDWRSQGIGYIRNCMFMLDGESTRSSYGDMSFQENDISTRSSFVENYYSSLYLVINHANTIIAGLNTYNPSGLSSERKLEILGEAYFNRAFANMMLLKSFGEFWDANSKYGIVLYDTPITGNTSKARSTVAESYDFISTDIDNAIKYAPEFNGHSYYANKEAAKAIKARMQLYMQDYNAAVTTCNDIITTGQGAGLTLENNYNDIFEKRFNSSEHILTVYTSYPNEQISTQYGMPSVFFDQGAFYNTMLFQVADSLVGTIDDWDYYNNPQEGIDRRFYETFLSNTEWYMYAPLMKYPINNGVDDNTFYFIRLAEIYLIKAEAEARLGNYNEARQSLKPITDRAGYPSDYVNTIQDKDLLQRIFEHKYIELCAENFESWYDIVRYHVIDGEDFSRYDSNYRVKFTHLILPIPYQALASNGALVQNPDYVYEYDE